MGVLHLKCLQNGHALENREAGDLVEGDHMLTQRRKEYQPHTNPGLWREFVSVHPTQKGFLGFVQKYGPLEGKTFNVSGQLRIGDTIESLKRAHRLLTHVMNLWEALQAKQLPAGILSEGSRGYLYTFYRTHRWFAAADAITAGWDALQWVVNESLQTCGLHKRLLWDARIRSSPCMTYLTISGPIYCTSQRGPSKETDATNNARPECSAWYEISSPEGSRRDKKYCSDNCKSKNYQRKRREAQADV